MTEPRQKKNWLEWVVFGVGLVLTVAVLGYLAYQGLTSQPRTPTLVVTTEPATRQGAQYVMPVRVRNTSAAPAEAVHVRVVLFDGGQESEKADFTLQFAPPHSERKGWVTFSKDPGQADRIDARAVGYQNP